MSDIFLHIEDMTWPNPTDPGEVNWKLRYGILDKTLAVTAASYVDAFCYLVMLPIEERERVVTLLKKKLNE